MLFDTDVLIWALRGNLRAARTLDAAASRAVSVISYMELVQGARHRAEVRAIRSLLTDLELRLLPLSENIGQRAAVYMEEHALSGGLRMADALIGATAVELGEPLMTANRRHFRVLADVDLHVFRP